jgi:predicted transcriptional regulator of viral defense system
LLAQTIRWDEDALPAPPTGPGQRYQQLFGNAGIFIHIMEHPKTPTSEQAAVELFREHGGLLKTGQVLELGVHPRTLYAMRESGALERISRGVYRLGDLPPLAEPDLLSVATRVPQGVVCLISALAFHELTLEIPHYIYLALKRGAEPPRLEFPPLRIFWLTDPVYEAGIETHTVDGVPLRVYGMSKTVADCFKYRNKIGLGVAVEALKMLRAQGPWDIEEILHFARICRVEAVIRPYVQALA